MLLTISSSDKKGPTYTTNKSLLSSNLSRKAGNPAFFTFFTISSALFSDDKTWAL